MNLDELAKLADTLRNGIADLLKRERANSPPTSLVGFDSDPLHITFNRQGSRVSVHILRMDENLRGQGILCEESGFIISSLQYPYISLNHLYVRGADKQQDNIDSVMTFANDDDAAEWVARAFSAVIKLNKKYARRIVLLGSNNDPIQIRLEQIGTKIKYACLHTDHSLRGKYLFYKGKINIVSVERPGIGYDAIWVWGDKVSRDLDVRTLDFGTNEAVAAWIAAATTTITDFNKKWRMEKTEPTVEQDIQIVRDSIPNYCTGTLEAFNRLVEKLK